MSEEHHTIKTLEFRLGALHDDVREVRGGMNKLADAITKLALIEERQGNTNVLIGQVSQRMELLDARVSTLEIHLPGVTRTSLWVDRGVLFVVGAVVMFVLKSAGVFGA